MATTELTRSPAESAVARRLGLARLTLPAEFTAGRGRSVALIWVTSRAAMMLVLGLLGGPARATSCITPAACTPCSRAATLRQTLQEYPVPVLASCCRSTCSGR